jgi:hypothetical protein
LLNYLEKFHQSNLPKKITALIKIDLAFFEKLPSVMFFFAFFTNKKQLKNWLADN